MTKPPEHDTICQRCGSHVPAGTPQHQILGAGPTCEPCGKRAQESFFRWKRTVVESNRRRREKEYQEREAFASEGGALGPAYECARCGEDYFIDRPHFSSNVTTRHLCDVCEHIDETARLYEWNLRGKHGQTSTQLRGGRGARAEYPKPRRASS